MNPTWRTTVVGCVTILALGTLQALGKLDAGTLSAILGIFGTLAAKHAAKR